MFVVFLLFITVVPTLTVINMALSYPTFFYVGRDPTTRGNWIEHEYGDCLPKCGGYALPYAEIKEKEVAIGETTGIGESAHEFWWREPWGVPGEKYYPYEDYRGGKSILEYEIIGPEGAPRALVDKDSAYYRPSWYCNDSSITVTLNGIIGNYNVSIYLLDWDAPAGGQHRRLQVNVTSSGAWDATTLGTTFPENFAAGTYAVFEVNSDGIIKVEVMNLGAKERYAVIAGIFLDTIPGPVTGVNFLELDRETKGNWRPSYGNGYYLLPGFNVPLNGVSYKPVNKLYDETNIPLGNYAVSEGVCQYAADDARTYGSYPYIGQYAAYAWTLPLNLTASDPRVLIYPEDKIYYGYPPTPLNGRILGVWDSGEMGWPLNYFIIKLEIPAGKAVLSVYVMDFARIGRSETIEIWDESMTTLLDSQYVTGDEINEGVYLQWYVEGSRTINIKVIADQGNLNSFVNGIFLNCLGYDCYYGKTIGFWMCDILKALLEWNSGVQVSREDIVEALDTITALYGTGSTWDFEWLTFEGSDDDKLIKAFQTLWQEIESPSVEAEAQAHILALLLTDVHYGKHFCVVWIGWYEGGQTRTVTGWITTILGEFKDGNYETAKNLADHLNEL